MNLTKQNIKKICGIILFTVVIFLAIQNMDSVFEGISFIWGIVSPFVLGGVIAFILNIPMRSIEKNLFKKAVKTIKHEDGTITTEKMRFVRPVSLLITLILVIVVISAVMLIVVPQIGGTAAELVKVAEAFFPKLQMWAEDIFRNNEAVRTWISGLNFNLDGMIDKVVDFMQSGVGDVLSGTVTAAIAVVSGITSFAIGLIFACYILAKKENLARQAHMILRASLPDKAVEKIEYIAHLCDDTFSSFIAGQCIEALILGTMFFVVMTIIGLPYPLLISVLLAFTSLIPIFGAFIGCVIGTFLIIMISPMQALIFVITFLVIQQIEGNVIYPKVVGGSIGLPSLWVLAAVTIGSSLMGIAGMLFFIPFTSVIYTLVREWTYKRLEEKESGNINEDNEEVVDE